MPYFHPAQISSQNPHLAYSGRLMDIELTPGTPSSMTLALFDTDFSPGVIYRQSAAELHPSGLIREAYAGMSHAFAIFEHDPDRPNPLQKLGRTAYKGDWVLKDVITSGDCNLQTAYCERSVQTNKKRSGLNREQQLLSEAAKDVEILFKSRYPKPELYREVVDGIITVFHKLFDPQTANYDLTQDTHHANPSINQQIIQYVADYLKYTEDIMEWSVPCRAFRQLESLSLYQKRIGNKDFDKTIAQDIEARRDGIRDGVVKSLAAVYARSGPYKLSDDGSSIDPIRWKLTAIDAYNKKFADIWKAADIEELKDEVREVARKYGKLPVGQTLLIEPTLGNELLNLSLGRQEPEYAQSVGYRPGQVLGYNGGRVSNRQMIRNSLYNPNQPNMLDGIVADFAVCGMNMSASKRYLVLDLLRAPSLLLRQVVEAGHFTGKKELKAALVLSEMLAQNNKRYGSVTLALFTRSGVEVIKEITTDKAITLIHRPDGNTAVRSTVVEKKDVYAVNDRAPYNGEQEVVSVANHGDTIYVRAPNLPPNLAKRLIAKPPSAQLPKVLPPKLPATKVPGNHGKFKEEVITAPEQPPSSVNQGNQPQLFTTENIERLLKAG